MSDRPSEESGTQEPPRGLFPTLRRIGPGLIIAGSIVGSGELIATTKTGADAGFWLLWLIVIGCLIKVFVQVELGRYTISSGETTITAMNRVPGPRLGHRGNWILWYWFVMFVASIAQLGGIVGGVGQALSISLPLTADGRLYDRIAQAEGKIQVDVALWKRRDLSKPEGEFALPIGTDIVDRTMLSTSRVCETLRTRLDDRYAAIQRELLGAEPETWDRLQAETIELQQKRDDLNDLIRHAERVRDAIRFAEGNANVGADDDPAKQLAFRTIAQMVRATQEQWSALIELDRLRAEVAAADAALSVAEAGDRESRIEAARLALASAAERAAALEAECRLREADLGNETGRPLTDAFATYRSEIAGLSPPIDDKLWAGIVAIITSLILIKGRFGLILSFSTAMVASFTAATVLNLFLLQSHEAWSVSWNDLVDGFRFRLPPGQDGDSWSALSTALKTFGIIGVGATELVAYPYWCAEQGYARFTGPRDESEDWARRARGWIRVMWVDAWGSMLIYTFATIAFYLLGAAVLGRSGVLPSESNLIRYLTVMFEPVFGSSARLMFLFGVFAVLYSTLFVATASHARVFGDALRVLRFVPPTPRAYDLTVMTLSGLFPMICLAIYLVFPKPTFLVMLSGLMQAIMLPMLALTAIFLRRTRLDRRLAPGLLSDVGLIVSSLGMLVAGGWLAWSELAKLL